MTTPSDDGENPFAAPSAPQRPTAETLVADGLGAVFGVLGLGTWGLARSDSIDLAFASDAVIGVMYCVPMAITAVVLGVAGIRRGRRPRFAWSAAIAGVIGLLGVPGSLALILLVH